MTTKTIEEFLKTEDARLSLDYRWLIWDDTNWIVFSKPTYKRVSRVVYNGTYLVSALEALRTGVR